MECRDLTFAIWISILLNPHDLQRAARRLRKELLSSELAHTRRSGPESGSGFQANQMKTFQVLYFHSAAD